MSKLQTTNDFVQRNLSWVHRYRNGESMTEIAQTAKVSRERVRQILTRYNIVSRPNGSELRGRKRPLTTQQRQWILRYKGGESGVAIAKDEGVSHTNVYRVLHAANITMKTSNLLQTRKARLITRNTNWKHRYTAGESSTEIARTDNVSQCLVLHVLHKMNVHIRPRGRRYKQKK